MSSSFRVTLVFFCTTFRFVFLYVMKVTTPKPPLFGFLPLTFSKSLGSTWNDVSSGGISRSKSLVSKTFRLKESPTLFHFSWKSSKSFVKPLKFQIEILRLITICLSNKWILLSTMNVHFWMISRSWWQYFTHLYYEPWLHWSQYYFLYGIGVANRRESNE